MLLKGATSRFVHLEKFSLNFSSSPLAIRVNFRHPLPSSFLYGLFLPIWCLSTLAGKRLFQGFIIFLLYLKAVLYDAKNDSKYRDVAP